MLNDLLDIVARSDGNYYFDNFGEAVIYAVIGFVIVFLGIVLIICIIWLVGLVMRKTNNFAFLRKSKETKQPAAARTAAVPAAEEEGVPDEVRVAVIAAVMAYCAQEKPQCQFKVKRIKRL